MSYKEVVKTLPYNRYVEYLNGDYKILNDNGGDSLIRNGSLLYKSEPCHKIFPHSDTKKNFMYGVLDEKHVYFRDLCFPLDKSVLSAIDEKLKGKTW